MAVYYATTQQRTLGRLLKAKDVRLWIKVGNRTPQNVRLVPSLDDIVDKYFPLFLIAGGGQVSEPSLERAQPRIRDINTLSWLLHFVLGIGINSSRADTRSRPLLQLRFDFVSSEPDDYSPDPSAIRDTKREVIYHCFTPSVASVITISAPQMLLSSSLAVLLIALAIYFGFSGLGTSTSLPGSTIAETSSLRT